MRTTRSFLLNVLPVLVACSFFAPPLARADRTIAVLGILSMEGDDEVAQSLTGAIRHAASRVDGWQLSRQEVTLTQMALAHGCSDEPDTGCLTQIAATLGVQAVIYGILRRTTADGRQAFQVSLAFFDAATQHIERSVAETIYANRTDIDDLREPARRMIARLSGPAVGSLRLFTNVPGASVTIDGEVAGTTDASGTFVAASVPVGAHAVGVRGAGHLPWSGSVTVTAGTEMELHAELDPVPEAGQGGGGSGESRGGGAEASISWPGIALIGVGAVALGMMFYTWFRIDAIQNDPDYTRYRTGVSTNNVCDLAAMESMSAMNMERMRLASSVNGLCGEAGTLEVLQYVFLAAAVGAAGTGVALLALDSGGGERGEQPRVALTPHFGRDGGALTVGFGF
jgi:hypothetical protein